jgi:AraC-like DNA-binding protein
MEPSRKEIFAHSFLFFCVLAFRLYFGEININLLGIIFVIYSLFHYYLLVKSSTTFLRQYHSIFTKKQLFKVKQITIWILALGINNFVFTSYYIIISPSNKQEAIINMFHSSVVLWVLFLLYLLFNPSILFNEVVNRKDPNRDFSKKFDIWNSKAIQKLEPQDIALELIVQKNIDVLIEDLRQLKPELFIQSNSTQLIQEISKHLHYPKSHLKYVLKYHCRFSQNDYLNLMRVIYALKLINNGYLDNYTLESLMENCHFNSRTSFHRHFKKHLGVTPSRYKIMIN